VATIVNAIGKSQFWDSTTIFISWDDWGGWYDHVPPPQVDDMGLGFRVPVIVVSPYAKRGYVSHVTHESGGFLRYTEVVFNLPSLGTRDSISDDFSDCFDYSQPPAPYVEIPTGHSREFFLAQKYSGLPDDD
jgi:phospholipase C